MGDESPTEIVEQLLRQCAMLKTKEKNILLTDCNILRKNIGLKISQVRKKKGFTQAKLCKIVELSQPHLANLENGKINQIDTLCKIANALNEPISSFFEGEEKQGGDLYKIVAGLQHQIEEMKNKFGK